MTITVIGLGLIGSSMALILKDKGFTNHIIGVDLNDEHCKEALALGIANEIMDYHTAISQSKLIILSIPVDQSVLLLPGLLDLVDEQIIMDVGSVKTPICGSVTNHIQRKQFVASHPMWGTEYSGPGAALKTAFKGKAAVICNKLQSSPAAIELVEQVYTTLGMHIVHMDAASHDLHTAYISHVSHITSFALANTVLEKEKEDNTIFELASGGFESTARLAKSNPSMWLPIFKQNKENVLDVLNEHIVQLRKFKTCLEKENYTYLAELMENANKIKRILK